MSCFGGGPGRALRGGRVGSPCRPARRRSSFPGRLVGRCSPAPRSGGGGGGCCRRGFCPRGCCPLGRPAPCGRRAGGGGSSPVGPFWAAFPRGSPEFRGVAERPGGRLGLPCPCGPACPCGPPGHCGRSCTRPPWPVCQLYSVAAVERANVTAFEHDFDRGGVQASGAPEDAAALPATQVTSLIPVNLVDACRQSVCWSFETTWHTAHADRGRFRTCAGRGKGDRRARRSGPRDTRRGRRYADSCEVRCAFL